MTKTVFSEIERFQSFEISSIQQLINYCYSVYQSDLKRAPAFISEMVNYYSLKKESKKFQRIGNLLNDMGYDRTKIDSANNRSKELEDHANAIISQSHSRKYEPRNDSHLSSDFGPDKGKSEFRGNDNTENVPSFKGFGRHVKGKGIKVEKHFNRPQIHRTPFSFSDLNTYFEGAYGNDLPILNTAITAEDVKMEDAKAFSQYCEPSTNLSRTMFALLCRSSIASFNILGLDPGFKESHLERYRPWDLDLVMDTLSKNTNSGYFSHGRKNDPIIIKETREWVERFLSNPRVYTLVKKIFEIPKDIFDLDSLSQFPIYIMHRFQISPKTPLSKEFDTKIRQVWCVPYAIVVLECYFFGPQIDLLKANAFSSEKSVFPIGLSNLQLSNMCIDDLNRERVRARLSGNNIKRLKSLDYSKFDRNVQIYWTIIYFCLWRTRLILTEEEYIAYSSLRLYTCFSPFIYNNEIMVTRRGVCSGSYTTNARDTFVNVSLIVLAKLIEDHVEFDIGNRIIKENVSVHSLSSRIESTLSSNVFIIPDLSGTKCYGDDGIILAKSRFFLIHENICKDLGFTAKYSDELKDGSFFFLGRFWDTQSRPWHTVHYMMAHIMFRTKWYDPEDVQFDISKKLHLYRVLSICLPLRGGFNFVSRVLGKWKPMEDFLNSKEGFWYLKDYPTTAYEFIDHERIWSVIPQ